MEVEQSTNADDNSENKHKSGNESSAASGLGHGGDDNSETNNDRNAILDSSKTNGDDKNDTPAGGK